MKLKTKLFLITDSTGEEMDIENRNIGIYLNGEKHPASVAELFNYAEYDEGEIYGNSLLSYYQVTDDGKLSVEGSTIELRDNDTQEQIKFVRIVRPSVNDDGQISFDVVRLFSESFTIAKPDEVFTDLTDEEKQIFISERAIQEATTQKQKAAAQKALDDAETERLAAEKSKADSDKAKADAEKLQQDKEAEAQLKESIDPKLIQEKKDYKATQNFYAGIDFKEYIHPPYHLFYGKSEEDEPSILIKRGETWWEESADAYLNDENDKTATIVFTDGEIQKQLTLNIETGEINISDVEA